MILIHNLSKVYGQNTVLKNISMRFDEGKIYGLIGSNGCGKTTLMRCICGFSQPTSGYIVVNGCLIGGRSRSGGILSWLRPMRVSSAGYPTLRRIPA